MNWHVSWGRVFLRDGVENLFNWYFKTSKRFDVLISVSYFYGFMLSLLFFFLMFSLKMQIRICVCARPP